QPLPNAMVRCATRTLFEIASPVPLGLDIWKKGGHDIVAVVFVGVSQAVFDKEQRPIADALSGPSRARGAHVWLRQNDFPIICRDDLDPGAARPPVTDKALTVPLSARSVFLIIKVAHV